MAREGGDDRQTMRRPRGPALLRFLYGAGLVALGACLGIVIGSLTETPRLLLERMSGPVETVEIAAPVREESASEPASPRLELFSDLQEGKMPKPAKVPNANSKPKAEAAPPPELVPPSELPTSSAVAPPAVAAAPAAAAAPLASATASEPPAAIAPSGGAVVQVASYDDRKPADELVAKLKTTGFEAYVSQPAAANGRYRVRIRPDAGESAGDLATRLRGFGFDTWATSE